MFHSFTPSEAFVDRSYAGRDGDDSDTAPGPSYSLSRREVMQTTDILHRMVDTVGTQKRDTWAGSGKAFREVTVRLRLEEQVAIGSIPP